MSITHDSAAACQFLQLWNPNGPWILTAIHPESGQIETITCHKAEQVAEWVDTRQGKKNLYFMVNQSQRSLTTKAKKEDVSHMLGLHVDVDPRVGEDLKRERLRARKALETMVPKPTVIIDSGGGYQGFWKLAEPIPHADNTEALEAYNRGLAEMLGGDNCHNIDRIMRLPGTVNVPNAKKMAKGRVPALAAVVEADWERTYTIADFTPAQAASDSPRKAQVSMPECLPVVDVAMLPVSERCKAIILKGFDPEEPQKHPSRSEWLFSICCEMARKNVADEKILAVITNPANGISASVLDKPKPTVYAAKQVEKAKAQIAEPPELAELNAKHFVVNNFGGSLRIAARGLDEVTQNECWIFQKKNDFLGRYAHRSMIVGQTSTGKLIEKPLGLWWFQHRLRREYNGVLFMPEKTVQEDYFNLWEGFAFTPVPGNNHLSLLKHLRDNICNGNPEAYTYMLNWMANLVQNPAQPGGVAIVLIGEKGTGKGNFVGHLGKLFGHHYVYVSDPRHVTGNFNAHLHDCLLLFADEAMPASSQLHQNVLKALITEKRMMVERKGVDSSNANNFIHLIMASNSSHAVHYTPDERRYLVLDVSNAQKGNLPYFDRIEKDMINGGYANLLYELQNRDISKWWYQKIPYTEAARNQLIASLGKFSTVLWEILQDGVLPGDDAQKQGEADLMCLNTAAEEVFGMPSRQLKRELERNGILLNRPSVQRRAWRNLNGTIVDRNPDAGAKPLPRRMYYVAPLAELREKFKDLAGDGWPDDGNVWKLDKEKEELPF